MKASKLILSAIFSATVLCGCANSKTPDVTYVLGFYQDEGNQLDEMTVTVGKTTYQDVLNFESTITINERVGYDTTWEEFDFEHLTTDYVVEAEYVLHNYTISFVYEGTVLATTTYNIKSKSIEMPKFEDEGGYYYVPEAFEYKNRHEDFVVNVTREETPYQVTFVTSAELSTTLTYTISNPIVYTPAGQSGYNTKWVSGSVEVEAGEAIDFTGRLGHYTFNRISTPKEYKIKYVNGDGSLIKEQTVAYDSNYTLSDVISPNPEYDGVCWVDAEDKEFPQTGVWTLDHDVTLHAIWGLSFEKNTLPAALAGGNRVNYSICTDDATAGKQCLKVDIETHSGESGNYAVILAKSFLEDCFADPTVVAVNFDAKATYKTNNFRSQHFEDTKVSSWTYENNYTPCGVDTIWKTFSFKREYLNGYVDFIDGWLEDGQTLYVDNIRPVKRHLDSDYVGFENGYRVQNSSNTVFYDGGHANATPTGKQVFLVNGEATNSVDYDYTNKNEGNRSIKVSKSNGYSAIYISTALVNYLGASGYITFDVYSTVGCNSNPTTAVLLDGLSTNPALENHATGLGGEGYIHPANTWVTYTLPTSKMTADGRFLQITGSTGGDWYFDNIILHPAA